MVQKTETLSIYCIHVQTKTNIRLSYTRESWLLKKGDDKKILHLMTLPFFVTVHTFRASRADILRNLPTIRKKQTLARAIRFQIKENWD